MYYLSNPYPGCIRETASPKEGGAGEPQSQDLSKVSALFSTASASQVQAPAPQEFFTVLVRTLGKCLVNDLSWLVYGEHIGGAGNGIPAHSIPFRFQTDLLAHGPLPVLCTPLRHQAMLGSVALASHQPGSVIPNPSLRGSQPVPFHVFMYCQVAEHTVIKRQGEAREIPVWIIPLALNPVLGDKEKSQ